MVISGLLCWLDSYRGQGHASQHASPQLLGCQKALFPCPNHTKDWPRRNWLACRRRTPLSVLEANPFQILSKPLPRKSRRQTGKRRPAIFPPKLEESRKKTLNLYYLLYPPPYLFPCSLPLITSARPATCAYRSTCVGTDRSLCRETVRPYLSPPIAFMYLMAFPVKISPHEFSGPKPFLFFRCAGASSILSLPLRTGIQLQFLFW